MTLTDTPARLASDPLPPLTSGGHAIDPAHLGPMADSDPAEPVEALRDRMARDGYLLLRGLLDADDVRAARHSVCARLAADGMLDPTHPVDHAIAPAGSTLKFKPDAAAKNPEVERLIYGPTMMGFFARFLGGPARHFDFTWLRAISPGVGTPTHCDVVFMGRGETQRLFTAWTPLGDVTFDLGGLLVLAGSHRHRRLRETYGNSDVDNFCENRPVRHDVWPQTVTRTVGYLGKNPNHTRRSLTQTSDGDLGRWVTAEFDAGDVVVFSTYTVHGSTDNATGRFRLSTDSRYQPADAPADERWIGENPPGHSTAGKRGRIC